MRIRILYSTMIILALVLTACGAETGSENQNTNAAYPGSLNSNSNLNANGNLNGNLNANSNTNAAPGVVTSTGPAIPNTGATPATGAYTTPGGTTQSAPAATQAVSSTQATTSTQPVTGQATAQSTQSGAYGTTPMVTESSSATGATPMATQQGGGAVLPNSGLPQQSQAAQVRGQREQILRLSDWVGFKVMDPNGDTLGTVSDYVINTCETYIIYMVVTPADGGGRVLVPFETVTINSGAIDVQNKALIINATPALFKQAPAFPESAQLSKGEWEGQVRSYWKNSFRVSNLSTECGAPGGPVYKVAYASQLLNAQLKDGNQKLLGTVKDAIVEPESGKIQFFVVQTSDQQGYVLMPLAAVNIPEEALNQTGQAPWLVLLTDTAMLQSAPRINDAGAATNMDMQNAARGYWNGQNTGTPPAPMVAPSMP